MPENAIIQSLPLREQVAEIVRVMILKGELQIDQPISERYISQMLNVSTTPVKEAFRLLQAEGLIYSVPRKGSYVSSTSKNNMKQITFIRSAMEGVAAYYAAIYATQDEIDQMAEKLRLAGEQLGDPDNRQRISEYNVEFHAILRNASRNAYLTNLLASLRSIDNSLRSVNLNSTNVDPAQDHAEHLEILDAVRQRDPARAEQSIISHIRRVAHTVLDRN